MERGGFPRKTEENVEQEEEDEEEEEEEAESERVYGMSGGRTGRPSVS